MIPTAPKRPATERESSQRRPRGASTHRCTVGCVSAPWVSDSKWGRKQSPWACTKSPRSKKPSNKTLRLPAIDVRNSSNAMPELNLPHCLGCQSYIPSPPPDGKPKSNPRIRKESVDSVSTEASWADRVPTAASWADQLMALGASKDIDRPEDRQITGRATLEPPVPEILRPSIQEEPHGTGAIDDHTLRPPSARSATSDGGCSTTSVHFKMVNGQLTPLDNGREHVATTDNDVQNLTAANLAKLESKTSSELSNPDDDDAKKKKKKNKKKANRFKSSSTAKSDASCTPKSSKSVKSTRSNLSDGSVVSGLSFKALGHVVRAIHAFRKPLRHGHHAHTGRYECQYCFEDLGSRPVALLMGNSSKRSCGHLFHQDCCAQMQEQANKKGASRRPRCPCCNVAFSSCVNLPDPETETDMWFDALDYTKCGKVNKDDVMDHLMAVLEVKTALRDSLAPGPSKINLPSCKALIERLNGSSNKNRRRAPPVSPDVEKNPSEWFAFWDIYEDGMLNRLGATRALMKTYTKYDKLLLRAAIDDVWPAVVASGSEADKESVTKDDIFHPITGLLAQAKKKYQAAFHWRLLREFNPG